MQRPEAYGRRFRMQGLAQWRRVHCHWSLRTTGGCIGFHAVGLQATSIQNGTVPLQGMHVRCGMTFREAVLSLKPWASEPSANLAPRIQMRSSSPNEPATQTELACNARGLGHCFLMTTEEPWSTHVSMLLIHRLPDPAMEAKSSPFPGAAHRVNWP